MSRKKAKKKRLEPTARIRRRLMRLWTECVHLEFGGKCAVCGSTSTPNAHHLENRNTCRALRYDPSNGILLCPSHHKFGKDSAHKGGIWFADWLLKHRPYQFAYVLEHRNETVNLNDREVLAEIEARLRSRIEDARAKNIVASQEAQNRNGEANGETEEDNGEQGA